MRRFFVTNDGKDFVVSMCDEFLEIPKNKYKRTVPFPCRNRTAQTVGIYYPLLPRGFDTPLISVSYKGPLLCKYNIFSVFCQVKTQAFFISDRYLYIAKNAFVYLHWFKWVINCSLCDTAEFVRTTSGVTPRSFLADTVSTFSAVFGEKRPKSSPTSVDFIVPNAVKSIFKQFYKSKFEIIN